VVGESWLHLNTKLALGRIIAGFFSRAEHAQVLPTSYELVKGKCGEPLAATRAAAVAVHIATMPQE